jgi:hypothetical protein
MSEKYTIIMAIISIILIITIFAWIDYLVINNYIKRNISKEYFTSDYINQNIPGDVDSGKLTFNNTPQYSTLTNDIGTQARIITDDKFSKPPQYNFGVNVWNSSFVDSEKLFNSRYKPTGIEYMPNYPKRYSVTGDYYDEGPLASNDYIE